MRRYLSFNRIDHRPIEFQHRVVVRINNFDLFFSLVDHLDHTILNLRLSGLLIVMKQLVFFGVIELRVRIVLHDFLEQSLVGIFYVQNIAVLVCRIHEMLAILIQCNVLSEIVQILVLTCPISDSSIAALDIGRTYQPKRVRNDKFLVMTAPNIFIEITINRTQPPLWIKQQKPTPTNLQLLYEFRFGPKLHIIHKQYNMNPSFCSFDKFDKRSICSRGRVNRIRGNPEVVFAGIYHLPHSLKKLIAFSDELCVGKSADFFEFEVVDLLVDCCLVAVEGLGKQLVNIHVYNINLAQNRANQLHP